MTNLQAVLLSSSILFGASIIASENKYPALSALFSLVHFFSLLVITAGTIVLSVQNL